MLPNTSTVATQSGNYLLFSGQDIISNHLFRHGIWEPHILQLSRLFYSDMQAPLVLDIGANLGAYAIPVARDLVASAGELMAFEPQRIVFYQLCANIVLNRLDNCHAFQYALGEQDGFIEIPEVDYARNFNNGAFSLIQQYRQWEGVEPAMKSQHHRVNMLQLDSLKLRCAPALIKMDVEGYEIHVLRGASRFLEQHGYPPIIFEAWSSDAFAPAREQLMALLRHWGYGITRVGEAEYLAQHPGHAVALEFTIDGDNWQARRAR